MDISKFFTVICAFLLIVCLTLAITSLVTLRHAVNESTGWQSRAELLVGNLDSFLEGTQTETVPVDPENSEESTTEPETYCLKAVNGTLGIYTGSGYLIRMLDIRAELLPNSEQTALQEGIQTNSWEAMLALIQDYE